MSKFLRHMSINAIQQSFTVTIPLVFVFVASPTSAQSIEDLKKDVDKIVAQVDGKTRVVTGFIVRLEKGAAYIVTAALCPRGTLSPP
jgi:hypothetical protein